MKPVILFVDDEPNILRGLRRLLRHQKSDWEMIFLEGGEEAVDWLSKNEVDAIVTDMRMPKVDGGQVLKEAARMRKGRIRLVLSGEADRELTCSTVGACHQFFSKPCDDRRLVNTLNSTFSLGDDILDIAHQKYIANLPGVPSSSKTHNLLNDVFENGGDKADIIRIAAQDPGLALRLLQLANSSYFGRPSPTLSIAKAVNAIGMPPLKMLWELDRLVYFVDDSSADEFLEDVSSCAVETAQRLYGICAVHGIADKDCEDGYATGLLSWVGETMTVGSNDVAETLPPHLSMSAAAFASCVFGLPMRMSHIIERLARTNENPIEPAARAEELGAVMFENRRAA